MKALFYREDSGEIPVHEIYGDVQGISRIFYLFIWTTLIGLLIGIFIVLTAGKIVSAMILAGATLPTLFSAYLVRLKKFEVAAAFLAIVLILINTILATRGLGIHHISNFAYPAILILASLVTQKRTMFALILLTVLCIAWLVFGELAGLYTPGVLDRSVPTDFLSASLIVVSTAVLVRYLTETLFQSLSRLQKEVTDRKSAENTLRQREAILEAVTFAAEQFLKTPGWRENINIVLERLGRTIHATHAYLFELHLGIGNEMLDSMQYEWTRPGYTSDLGDPEFQNIPMDEPGFERYYETLRGGHPFIGNTSTFLPAEREHFSSLGIKAILEVPLFVNGQWWGTIGFDDFEQEREWAVAEVDVLKIAAGILSGAIQRDLAESAVKESERIYRQAIEAAGAVPYYQDYIQGRYTFIGGGIEKMTGYTPQEFTPQLWGEIVRENILLGEGERYSIHGGVRESKSDVLVAARNGEERWLNVSAVEMLNEYGISYASVGILQDITDRKLAEFSSKKHESLLEAVAYAAEQFLKAADWREKIDSVLEKLGREFHASHAYLFERQPDDHNEIRTSMICEWTAAGMQSDLDGPEFQNMPPNPMGFERLYKILDGGEPLVGSASFFNAEEKEYLRSINVMALLEIRVVVNGNHWGTLGLDDITREREWSAMEVDVIRVAAGVLGAAIERQLNDDALKRELAERKRAEMALRFSEEKFSKAFDTSPVLMTIEDDHHRFIDANKAFTDTFGYEREEVIGRSSTELNILYDPTDVAALRGEFQEKGFLRDYEVRFRRRSGEMGFALLSSEKIYLENREYTLTSGLNITDRKFAEVERELLIADLQAKNAESETLRETTVIVTTALDISEAVQRILEQLKLVVEYDSASVWLYTGDTAHMVGGFGLPDLPEPDKHYIVNESEPDYPLWTRDLPYVLLDDVQQTYSQFREPPINYIHGWLCIPLKVRGDLTGFISLDGRKVGQFTDRHAQLALNYANQVSIALEKARLFSDLQNELAERKKLIGELESKNSELERFTYTVSHDLKSPLVTIKGFLGYLEQDVASGNLVRFKKDTQRIQEAVDKMQTLLRELLELSRIGRIMNAPVAVPFEELAREAVEIVHGSLQAGSVKIHIHAGLSTVFGDRPRLVEVLQNLIDNATKYMGTQTDPLVEVGMAGVEAGKPIFFVKDNGMGIALEYHDRIFELFHKLDAASEGTGVGLALVKRIVELHHGRIWVESEVGKGSVFFFTLPTSMEGISSETDV